MSHAIVLLGEAGSGKDTAAEYIGQQHDRVVRYSFALVLKRICCIVFNWDFYKINDDLQYKQSPAKYPNGELCVPALGPDATKREVLQYMGEQIFRDQVNPRTWINSVREQIRAYSSDHLAVFTDLRYLNEMEMIRTENLFDTVTVIRLERPEHSIVNGKDHNSENEWKSLLTDHVITVGEGDLDSLYVELDDIVTKIGSVSKFVVDQNADNIKFFDKTENIQKAIYKTKDIGEFQWVIKDAGIYKYIAVYDKYLRPVGFVSEQ